LRQWSIGRRLSLVTLMVLALLGLLLFFCLQIYQQGLMGEKSRQTQAQVETAYSLVAGLEARPPHHGDAPHETRAGRQGSLRGGGQAGAQAVRRLRRSGPGPGRGGGGLLLAQAGGGRTGTQDLLHQALRPLGLDHRHRRLCGRRRGPVPGGAAHPAGDRAGAGPPAVCRGRPHCAQHRRAPLPLGLGPWQHRQGGGGSAGTSAGVGA